MWELSGLNASDTYYNLLVQGFQAGQLNLKREAPAGLAQLADPYDPTTNARYRSVAGLHDLSYYQDRLYLYYGLTPALVLFWPWYELTSHYLPHRDAALMFCAIGFLASAGLLVALWRRYFAQVGVGVVGGCILALGLAGGTPLLLARSSVCEVPIGCGHALTMLALALIWGAIDDAGRRSWWLAGASLAYGLAVGARPSLLFGAVILLVPVGLAWREAGEPGRRRRIWTLLLGAAGPIVLSGLGLMLYNYLRFGDPLEFGQRYQLSAFRQDTMKQFSLGYLWFNFRVGFLGLARWSAHFPFVHDITVPPFPSGYYEVGHPFGLLTNVPLVWMGLFAPLAWRGRLGAERSALRCLGAGLVLLFGTCALILCLHNSMNLRYEVEFAIPLVWLAVMGILGLERALADRLGWRRATRWGWGLLLVLSVAFNLLARFELYAETHFTLGSLLFQRGKAKEAIAQLQEVLAIQPDHAQAHDGLAAALLQQGRVPEAIAHAAQVLRLRPEDAQAQYHWGNALELQGKFDEAIAHYAEAVKLQPDYAEAHFNWGNVLVLQGRLDEAQSHFLEALRLKPEYVEARCNLGNLLVIRGKPGEALPHFLKALKINPDYAEGHYYLAGALARQKKMGEAVAHFQAALKTKPGYAAAANDLAWILATETNAVIRDVDEAVRLAAQACSWTTNQVAGYLDTLGVAYAEAGRFKEAVEVTGRAVTCALAARDKATATRIEGRLAHYRQGTPYHAIPRGAGP